MRTEAVHVNLEHLHKLRTGGPQFPLSLREPRVANHKTVTWKHQTFTEMWSLHLSLKYFISKVLIFFLVLGSTFGEE